MPIEKLDPRKKINELENAKSSQEKGLITKKYDEATNERKEQIFTTLISLVKEKRKTDPDFKLDTKTLHELVKNNRSEFPGISSGQAVVKYWASQMTYLRKKVDEAIENQKEL